MLNKTNRKDRSLYSKIQSRFPINDGKSRQKQLDKIERLTPPASASKAVFDFPFSPIVTTLAVETTDLVIGYDRPLLAPINLTIRFGENIAIRGFNGIGKSTLLKH